MKMLYWMCEQSKSDLTKYQLEHAIKRNFGGHEKVKAYEIFKSRITKLVDESHDEVSDQVKKMKKR